MTGFRNVCAIILLAACTAPQERPAPAPAYIVLTRAGVTVAITPDFGGRVARFGLAGQESAVKFDAALAASQPAPPVDIAHAALPYAGQSLWVGPQSEWWTHQSLVPALQGESWPPDPYLTLAKTAIARAPYRVTLQGPASPYTGVSVRQTFDLLETGCLKVTAAAKNTRAEPVSWDLWTNIRVPGDAFVFAPVAGPGAIRPGPTNDPAYRPPDVRFAGGLAFADPPMAGVAAPVREGKVFLDPDAGWMAAVRNGQAFRVSFALLPKAAIHPAQGQVEFYFDQPAEDAAAGTVEMETHAAYTALPPGETMQAVQYWSVQPAAQAPPSADSLPLLAADIAARDPCGAGER